MAEILQNITIGGVEYEVPAVDKVKQTLSDIDDTYPLLASDTNTDTIGTGVTSSTIYDTGININPGKHSVAEGAYTLADGNYSHAEGVCLTGTTTEKYTWTDSASTTLSASTSISDLITNESIIVYNGTKKITNINYSDNTITIDGAIGVACPSGGVILSVINQTIAKGNISHAEGTGTVAHGVASHTEGIGSYAYGNASHAEGVSGAISVLDNWSLKPTLAYSDGAHVEGSNFEMKIDLVYDSETNSYRIEYPDEQDIYDFNIHWALKSLLAPGHFVFSEPIKECMLNSNPYYRITKCIDYGKEIPDTWVFQIELENGNPQSNFTGYIGGGVAGGELSHVEGCSNITLYSMNHAEGGGNVVLDICGHAEGAGNVAIGEQAHVEGYLNRTNNEYAHAEGHMTYAKGHGSHSEGYGTIAHQGYSHAEGYGSNNQNYVTYTNESYKEDSNNSAIIISESNLTQLSITIGDVVKHTNNSGDIRDNDRIAYVTSISYDEGLSAFTVSLSETLNLATTEYTKLERVSGIAYGEASHSEGYYTNALGYISHAEGQYTTAQGGHSHAEGYETQASGECSHAEGYYTTAEGQHSHAEGYGGSREITNPMFTWSSGTSNVLHCTSTLLNNIIVGTALYDEASNSTRKVTAVDTSSQTVTIDSEFYNHNTQTTPIRLIVLHSVARGVDSHTEGSCTIAYNDDEHAQGIYNLSNNGANDSDKTIHSIGIGNYAKRKNAIEVMKNGDVYVTGLGNYDGTNINGENVKTLQEVVGDADTDTWRKIFVNGNQLLDTEISTGYLELISGTGISLSTATTAGTKSTVTISANANSKDDDGYVTKGVNNGNKVWKTDNDGNPGWRDDADSHYRATTVATSTSSGTTNTAVNSGIVYLHNVENSAATTGVSIKGDGNTTVSCTANGAITISSSGGSSTDTWRPINVNGNIFIDSTTGKTLNIKSGEGISLTNTTSGNISTLEISTKQLPNEPFWFVLPTGCSISLASKPSGQTLEYSTNDGDTWNSFTTTTTVSVSAKQNVYFRGILNSDNSTSTYTKFSVSGTGISVCGNINTLWNYKNVNESLKPYCGYKLFQNCTGLTNANNLVIPDAGSNCCYEYMFNGCTSLITPPKLPATTLANNCYQSMFEGCSSLTEVPELPATNLMPYCYSNMFKGCTTITTAPELDALTLKESCYAGMFSGCTNLSGIICLATTPNNIPDGNTGIYLSATTNWMSGVASSGVFIKDNGTNWTTNNSSGNPWGTNTDRYSFEDTKVKQESSSINNTYPLLASNVSTSNIGTGVTNTSIYDTGININPNKHSVSEGSGTTASGTCSHAEGLLTEASGEYSHAEGQSTIASGNRSHAEGQSTVASGNRSHAEGGGTNAIGNRSHSEGASTIAAAEDSHTEGHVTAASNIAISQEPTTDELKSSVHAEGFYCRARGMAAHVEGVSNYACNNGAHAEGGFIGEETTLTWTFSNPVEWSTLKTTGNSGFTFSTGQTPSGQDVVFGSGVLKFKINDSDSNLFFINTFLWLNITGVVTVAIDDTIHENGFDSINDNDTITEITIYKPNNVASGVASHAEGYDTIASGSASHSEGCHTKAVGDYSHAGGYGTIANNDYMTAIGTYNNHGRTANDGTLFVVGNGNSSSTSDAFYVTTSGNCYAGGAFFASSDIRKKDIINDISLEKAFELVEKCQTVNYVWKNDITKKVEIGLIAQEVQQYFPEIVSEDIDGYLSLDYSKLSVILIKIIKNLLERVNKLENIEKRIEKIEKMI